MKKMLQCTAVIAVSFMFFAFSPAEKNNAIENDIVTSEMLRAGECFENYETSTTFSKCSTIWTEDSISELGSQMHALDGF